MERRAPAVIGIALVCAAAVLAGLVASPRGGTSPSAQRPTSGPTTTARTGPSGASATTRAPRTAPRFAHVVEVVMENLSYDEAMATPGFAALAHRYAYATDSFAASHPSLPNYLSLAAGSTFGIGADCLDCYVSADNLAAQLAAAHRSWGVYVDAVATPCYLGTSYGTYAAKHDPFRYFTDIRSSASMCRHLQPLMTLTRLLRGRAASVPAFSFVVPDSCHDGHDCAPAVAAAWLTTLLAEVTASAAWRDHGLVLVTWDEAEGDDRRILPSGRVLAEGGGGHVLTLVVAPGVTGGRALRQPVSDDSLLATVERDFSLASLAGAAAWRRDTLSVP